MNTSAMSCPASIGALKSVDHPYAKLLKLPKDTTADLLRELQKHNPATYAEVLKSSGNTRDEIVDKVVSVLSTTYLNAGTGYPQYVYSDLYDLAKDQAIMINLRQAIGAVKLCIDRYNPNKSELVELCKDAILNNMDKVKSLVVFENVNIYEMLPSFPDEQLCAIFNVLTELDCINVVRQNKLADFTMQLYQSATTYSYNSSACNHGTFVQGAQSLTKIMPEFVDQLAAHYARINDVITAYNLGVLPEMEAQALIHHFAKEMELLEFFMGEDIVAKDITAEQQKLFAVINHAFGLVIDGVLPDLKRMPIGEEYHTIISLIRSYKSLKEFMSKYEAEHAAEIMLTVMTPEQKHKMEEMKLKFREQAAKAAAEEGVEVDYSNMPPLERTGDVGDIGSDID